MSRDVAASIDTISPDAVPMLSPIVADRHVVAMLNAERSKLPLYEVPSESSWK